MILKIAGVLYILQIIIIYTVVICLETKYFIKTFKGEDKGDKKKAFKSLLKLVLGIPIMPFLILKYFLEMEYGL